MRRLLLAVILTASALYANTFTFTSCSEGTTTLSPCGGSYEAPLGLPNAIAGAAASDSSIIPGNVLDGRLTPIAGGQILSAAAEGTVSPSSVPVSESALAEAYDTYLTSGPPRLGLIQFDVSLGVSHYGNSHASLSDGTHTYSYEFEPLPQGNTPPVSTQCFESCGWTATVPFELGVPFQVIAEADNGTSFPASMGSSVSGGSDAIVEFTLFEADGTTPVPFFPVPEPATWALLIAGLGWLGFYFRRRQSWS